MADMICHKVYEFLMSILITFSERKTDSRKFAKDDSEKKQTTTAHGSEKKNEKSREYKMKGQTDEKGKAMTKVFNVDLNNTWYYA
jgi:hypothetical protein